MREDGMHVDEDGLKLWFKDGQLHREDGPAAIWADGAKAWFKDGQWYYSFDTWLEALYVSDEDKLFLKLKWA